MKQTEKNEIDLLLRSWATREKSRSALDASSVENQATGAHLDADELNSFAERALPAATRARFTTHLVDCSHCRNLVVQLTVAAGATVLKSEVSEQTGSTFWHKLRALLSPPVLRYAMPALALLGVITVGILFLSQQRQASFVARNEQAAPSQQAPRILTDQPGETHSQAPATMKSSPAGELRENVAGKADKSPVLQKEVGSVGAGSTLDSTSGFAKNAPKPAAEAESQPSFAPEPAAAPPAARTQTAVTHDGERNEAVAKQKEETKVGVVERETRDERAPAEDKDVTLSRSRKAAAAGRGGAGTRTMEARRGDEAQSKGADYYQETFAIEGRRFRKQGNTWVDTAYDSSRPTMTIARGSEQYRVLVADEPGIRKIAERLSGEVIVVWKGRVYRIR